MTPKQELFAREYLVDSNATQAALRAGYSPQTAESQGSRLLKNVEVAALVAAGRAKLLERAELTAQMVVDELRNLAFSNMLDYMNPDAEGGASWDLSALTRGQAAAIQELTVDHFMDGSGEEARPVRRMKLKLAAKREPLVDLGKHLGMWKDSLEIKLPISFIIHGAPVKAE